MAAVRPAPFSLRLMAFLMDGLIAGLLMLGPCIIVAVALWLLLTHRLGEVRARYLLDYAAIALGLLGVWGVGLAYMIVPVARHGATPGKRLVGLRIERLDGRPPGPGTALLRLFGMYMSFLTVRGAWMVLTRDDGRALHDLMAGTRVVEATRR